MANLRRGHRNALDKRLWQSLQPYVAGEPAKEKEVGLLRGDQVAVVLIGNPHQYFIGLAALESFGQLHIKTDIAAYVFAHLFSVDENLGHHVGGFEVHPVTAVCVGSKGFGIPARCAAVARGGIHRVGGVPGVGQGDLFPCLVVGTGEGR